MMFTFFCIFKFPSFQKILLSLQQNQWSILFADWKSYSIAYSVENALHILNIHTDHVLWVTTNFKKYHQHMLKSHKNVSNVTANSTLFQMRNLGWEYDIGLALCWDLIGSFRSWQKDLWWNSVALVSDFPYGL